MVNYNDMKSISRKDAIESLKTMDNGKDKIYAEILERESHHDHELLIDNEGKLWWKENPDFIVIKEKLGLEKILNTLWHLGYDKNSEVLRKLYRDNGYSMFGYWEIFYWDWNNELADEYEANKKECDKICKTIEQTNWLHLLNQLKCKS